MRLIITRHGETIENKQGIMQGQLQGNLSENGKEQAKKLSERLKNEKIDFIYSSDLARAAHTAKEIAKNHPTTPIQFTKELRERNMGEYQGKKINEFEKQKEGSMTYKKPEKGESIEEFYERSNKFLHDILHKHKKDVVLLVGHNGINKAIIGQIMNKNLAEMINIEKLRNTSINIFEIDENENHDIILFNCTNHLI